MHPRQQVMILALSVLFLFGGSRAQIDHPDSVPVAKDVPAQLPPNLPSTPTSPPPAKLASPPASPPPPPGTGSDRTAVVSVIGLNGPKLAKFNQTFGSEFTSAMSKLLGISNNAILIRNWQANRRRRALLADTIVVGSTALMGDGVKAVAGVNALKAADASGLLQASFKAAGLPIDSVSLQSASTAIPTNFQPINSPQGGSFHMSVWAIVLIAMGGAIVLLVIAGCCCPSIFCCCKPQEGEGRLPNMIKFGSMKDATPKVFFNHQTFTKTSGLAATKPLPT